MATWTFEPDRVKAGYDPIWFGVFLVAMTELAQITPPGRLHPFCYTGYDRPLDRFGCLCRRAFLCIDGYRCGQNYLFPPNRTVAADNPVGRPALKCGEHQGCKK